MDPAVACPDPNAPVPVSRLVGLHCDWEALGELGERIAEMAAHIEAATWRLLRAISEFDRKGGWNRGLMSCAHWLTWRCQWDPVTAREKVRVARALDDLPRISEALRAGRVSYSKVRAMTRVATPESEGELLNIALCGTASHVESVVRGYRRAQRLDSPQEEQARRAARYLEITHDAEGMVIIRARLTPEVGSVVTKALEAAMEQIRAEDRKAADRPQGDSAESSASAASREGADPGRAAGPPESPGRDSAESRPGSARGEGAGEGHPPERCRTADVPACRQDGRDTGGPHGDSAESCCAGPEKVPHACPADGVSAAEMVNRWKDCRRESPEQARADALGLVAAAALGPGLGCRERGEPFRVVVHVDEEILSGRTEEGRLELEGGRGVSVETCRRIACDAPVTTETHGPDGSVVDTGRRTRRVSTALWRLLQARDGHCRFPGCRRTGRLQAHHIRHWAEGGKTRPSNLLSLCSMHHWMVHEGGYRAEGDAGGKIVFRRPDGSAVPEVPPRPGVPGDAMGSLMVGNQACGLEITPETNLVRWGGEGLDLVTAVEGVLKAEGRW